MPAAKDHFPLLTAAWLALVALTLLSLGLSEWARDLAWLPLVVAAIMWLKGALIARCFIETHIAHPFIARVVQIFIASRRSPWSSPPSSALPWPAGPPSDPDIPYLTAALSGQPRAGFSLIGRTRKILLSLLHDVNFVFTMRKSIRESTGSRTDP